MRTPTTPQTGVMEEFKNPVLAVSTVLFGLIGFWVSRKLLHRTPMTSLANGVAAASTAFSAIQPHTRGSACVAKVNE